MPPGLDTTPPRKPEAAETKASAAEYGRYFALLVQHAVRIRSARPLMAEAYDQVNDAVTVLGQVIPLVWTPTGTTWDFGDGTSATGDGVEGADVGAPGAIEHSYARQGDYEITTATTYNLSFVLPGQGAQTISLTSPPSAPVTLPVREVQTLVDFTS